VPWNASRGYEISSRNYISTNFYHRKKQRKKTPKKTKPKDEGEKEAEEEPEVEKREVICDSVVARVKALNKSPSPKQYVVYDRAQAYPAFIVAFKVAGKPQEKTVSPREDEAHEEQEVDDDDEKNGKGGHEQPDDDN